jgi:hypothetical protein
MGWLPVEPGGERAARKPDGTPDADDSGNPAALDLRVEGEARDSEDDSGLVYREDFAFDLTAFDLHGAI